MGGNANSVQIFKDIFRNPVVQDTLAINDFVLLGVEGRRVILEELDQGSRFGALIQDFGFPFLDFRTSAHGFDF